MWTKQKSGDWLMKFFKVILFLCILLSFQTAIAQDCARIILINNSDKTVVGLVNGTIEGEIYSFMGAELDPQEIFNGSYCYSVGDYSVIWIIPGAVNRTDLFKIKPGQSEVILFSHP